MLNIKTLDQFFHDVGPDAGWNLIQFFIEETEERLARIKELTKDPESLDRATLQREAHSLKSAARTYGVDGLGDYAEQIDQACKDKNIHLIRDLCAGLPSTATRALSALKTHLANQ